MSELQITVTERTAEISGTPVIVCGNSDYTIRFRFDAEWERYTEKTARFWYRRGGLLRYQDVQFEGDSVTVPVLTEVDSVAVSVYAGSLLATTPVQIPCASCITDGSAAKDMRIPDVYNELMERLAAEKESF